MCLLLIDFFSKMCYTNIGRQRRELIRNEARCIKENAAMEK